MPKILSTMSETDMQYCVQVSRELKDVMRKVGFAFAKVSGKRTSDGIRFKEFCKMFTKLDAAYVKMCVAAIEKLSEEEMYNLTPSEIRDYCKEQKEEDKFTSKPKFKTFKVTDEESKVIDEAHNKFCLDNNIGTDTAYGPMIVALCADYNADGSYKEASGM